MLFAMHMHGVFSAIHETILIFYMNDDVLLRIAVPSKITCLSVT